MRRQMKPKAVRVGYENDLMQQRPLAWIQQKANDYGLAFRAETLVTDEDLDLKPCDSYAEFLGGLWKIITLGKRYLRWVMSDPIKKEAHMKGNQSIGAGLVETVNERIDLSIFRRCQRYSDYRPQNLKEWATRKGVDLEKIISEPEKFPQFIDPVTATGIESG